MRKTQNDRILDFMKQYGGITTKEAFENLGVTRLSARIFELRQSGVNIGQQTVKGRNRFGNVVCYDRYYIIKGEEDEIQKTE